MADTDGSGRVEFPNGVFLKLRADGVAASPIKLSNRVAIRAMQRYAAADPRGTRPPSIEDFRAVLEVLDEYQAEVEKRLAKLEEDHW